LIVAGIAEKFPDSNPVGLFWAQTSISAMPMSIAAESGELLNLPCVGH
jgi:hypothetical protein